MAQYLLEYLFPRSRQLQGVLRKTASARRAGNLTTRRFAPTLKAKLISSSTTYHEDHHNPRENRPRRTAPSGRDSPRDPRNPKTSSRGSCGVLGAEERRADQAEARS